MLRKYFIITIVFIFLTSCNATGNLFPEVSFSAISTMEPLASATATITANEPEMGNTIGGIVLDVSLSARIIMLKDSVEGYSVIALTENCELKSSNVEEIELRDLQPGMKIQATGESGNSESLLANFILIILK